MLERLKVLQRADSDKMRMFELMLCILIILTAVGIMLSQMITFIAHAKEMALIGTARTLYLAVEDYTLSQQQEGIDTEAIKNISKNSVFLKKYIDRPVKGDLKVNVTENGYVESIEYTEGGSAVRFPGGTVIRISD